MSVCDIYRRGGLNRETNVLFADSFVYELEPRNFIE